MFAKMTNCFLKNNRQINVLLCLKHRKVIIPFTEVVKYNKYNIAENVRRIFLRMNSIEQQRHKKDHKLLLNKGFF